MDKQSSKTLDQLTFPFHIFEEPNRPSLFSRLNSQSHVVSRSSFPFSSRFKIFKQVHAEEKESVVTTDDSRTDIEQIRYDSALEALAKAYIQRETGWDRVKMFFEKDHKGKSNVEMNYIQVALIQVFVVTFFGKYIPAAKFARKEFIRENQGTVFRTRFEAIRRLQDHVFLKAGAEAAEFSTKITLFSASFLFLSSMIATYRNKTTGFEYAAAAAITGGLARMNLGIKGFLGGGLVGGVLGCGIGLLGYLSLSMYGITHEERHLELIKSKLEVIRSIEGDNAFKSRVNQLLAEDTTLSTPSS